MSEAAEQLEAMAAEAEVDKGKTAELVKKIKTRSGSGCEGVVRKGTELGIHAQKEYQSVNQLHHSNLLPLHPTSIKQESGCISEP